MRLSADMMSYQMRQAKENGSLLFEPAEYLLPSQISGLITRFIKKGENLPPSRKRRARSEEEGLEDDINDLIDILL